MTRAVFTLGRLPVEPAKRRRAEQLADRLDGLLGGRRMPFGRAGRELGIRPNVLRYAAQTGRVVLRWDGARQPTIWTVPAPNVDPHDARLELARRYLHLFGPGTESAFRSWAGVGVATGRATFDELAASLTPVATPVGDAWILSKDEQALRTSVDDDVASTRLVPSGDAYFLLRGADRELLVPDPTRRSELWTSRVWPGAVVVDGEVAGTWRRAGSAVTIQPWQRLSAAARDAVEREALSFPLPDPSGPLRVTWSPTACG